MRADEFHEQSDLCSILVPSGSGFENFSSKTQLCAGTGSKPRLSYVNDDDYLLASFGYQYSHLWRIVGILIAFGTFSIFTCTTATEINPPPPPMGENMVVLKEHEPKHVKKAFNSSKAPNYVELRAG